MLAMESHDSTAPAAARAVPADLVTAELITAELITAELSAELLRQARLIHGLKAQATAWAPNARLDWAAFSLLANLIRTGPQRQSELAGCAMLAPSTVSRHVGQLGRAGFVERRPDPLDGRAVQLVPTAAGGKISREMGQRRDAALRTVLSAWDEDDVASLVALLRRLNDDFETRWPALHATASAVEDGASARKGN